MHDDDELPHIERATTSGILEFQEAARALLPEHYEYTPENARLLDLLFKRRASSTERTAHASAGCQFESDARP